MTRATYALVGTRTTARRGTGPGIVVYEVVDNAWVHRSTTTATNPGFLASHPDMPVVYAAHGDGTTVSAFRLGEAGQLKLINDVSTEGTNPAHITISPDGNHLLGINHTSGSLFSIALTADKSLGELVQVHHFDGEPGPHRTDQPGSKPHQVVFSPDGKLVIVPDKGLDVVHLGDFHEADGTVEFTRSIRLREFSGPRHVAVHPTLPVVYAINELSSTVAVISLEDGEVKQYLSTLNDTDVRDSRGAGIAINAAGTHLYASNRSGAGDHMPPGPGNDTIAHFHIRSDGLLSLGEIPTVQGQRPRFIALNNGDENLLVAMEKSAQIHALSLDPSGSIVEEKVLADVESPVCVIFHTV